MNRTMAWAVAAAGVLLSAGAAEAQVVTVVPNYVAGAGMNPPSAQPSGTYTVPAAQANGTWQILVDYGTLANGTFTPWAGVVPRALPITPPANGALTTWAQAVGVAFLAQPPAGLQVRAQLQKQVGFITMTWQTQHAAYAACP